MHQFAVDLVWILLPGSRSVLASRAGSGPWTSPTGCCWSPCTGANRPCAGSARCSGRRAPPPTGSTPSTSCSPSRRYVLRLEQIAMVDGTLIQTRDHRLVAQSKNYRTADAARTRRSPTTPTPASSSPSATRDQAAATNTAVYRKPLLQSSPIPAGGTRVSGWSASSRRSRTWRCTAARLHLGDLAVRYTRTGGTQRALRLRRSLRPWTIGWQTARTRQVAAGWRAGPETCKAKLLSSV